MTNDRERRILQHRDLCRIAARRFVRSGVERDDLEQTAMLGLIKAADRYDDDRGIPFRAFAWRYVLGELMHYVRDREHAIRVPRGLAALERRIGSFRDRHYAAMGRDPVTTEIAMALNISITDVTEAARTRRMRQSQDELSCTFDITNAVSTLSEPCTTERVAIADALRKLDHREQTIVLGSYVVGISQRVIGDRLGLSQRSVSRLHQRSLHKLALAIGTD